MFPSEIFVESTILKTGLKTETVKTIFFAFFADGSSKRLEVVRTVAIGLTKPSDLGMTALHPDECVLFYQDWSDCPKRGNAYPKQIFV